MNGTSGFKEVRSSTSRPPYRFLHEQRYRFGTGAWHLLHTHYLIALFTSINTTRETVPEAIFMPQIPTPWFLNRPRYRCCTRILSPDATFSVSAAGMITSDVAECPQLRSLSADGIKNGNGGHGCNALVVGNISGQPRGKK